MDDLGVPLFSETSITGKGEHMGNTPVVYLDTLNSSSFTFKAVKRFGLLFLCWGYLPRMPDGTGIIDPHLR